MVTKAQNGGYNIASPTFPDHKTFFLTHKLTQTRKPIRFFSSLSPVDDKLNFKKDAIMKQLESLMQLLFCVFLSDRT